tara:strand:+ start:308 stop:1000 length:693 start_codon:yes stop_codon:yes gene_type:complete
MPPKTKSRATTSSEASKNPKNIFSKAWYKARSEKKNKNQLKRYTTRLTELQKIKQPNDWQKNQIAHAKDQIKKYSPKTIKKAEKTINKSEKKINKVEKKVNKAEKKVNIAERTINKAEKKVNKAEKKVDKSSNNKEILKKTSVKINGDKSKNNNNKVKTKETDPLRKYRRTKGEGIEKKSEGYRGDTSITKRLKKSGWSETRLAEKRKAHAEWKANRKNKNKLKKNTMGG